ncbi:MAG TPA: hypothetical protein VFI73_12920 [Candidatus Nitrosopolaris sp.]|nr:hypothetical protein [Candidatus Nitrosopolaris sp.]
MSEYYGKYDKKQTVQLFVDNMIWGNISINSFASEMDGIVDFTRSLEQNIIDFHKNPTEETIDWIYKAIIKLRVHGAVSYVLRDISAEEVIKSLQETIKQKDEQINALHSVNIRLAEEVQNLKTAGRPMSKDFSALS